MIEALTCQDISDGQRWYPTANLFCQALALEYNISLSQACGIVSVLSPATSWPQNQIDAWNLCEKGILATVTAYPRQIEKALAILQGGPHVPLSAIAKPAGRKTRAFFLNLLHPDRLQYDGEVCAVTIDRHIFSLLLKRPITNGNFPPLKEYERLARKLEREANNHGILPQELQAALWCHQKRRKNQEVLI